MKQRHTSPARAKSSRPRPRGPSTKPRKAKEPIKAVNPLSLQKFEPEPNAVYTLETVAQLAGVPRRNILIYCRHKLISPITDPETWGFWFSAETIETLREIESLRPIC